MEFEKVLVAWILAIISVAIFMCDSYCRFQIIQNNQKEIVIATQYAKSAEYCSDAIVSIFGK